MKNFFPITFFFILSTILISFFYLLNIERDSTVVPSVFLNKKAPEFESFSLFEKKRKIFSSKEIGKKITLINFFASWCKPCSDEHPYLLNLSKNSQIKIIGINYKDDENQAIEWLKKRKNPYEIVITDKTGRISIDWGVYGIPETFIINSKGIIKYKLVGPVTKQNYKKIVSTIIKINNDD